MRSTLFFRIAAIALSTLAATMVAAALLTAQLVAVEYRQDLDRVLRRELTAVQLGLPEQLQAVQGPDGTVDSAGLNRAAQRYLALHPGSEQHLTLIRIGSQVLSTRDGPPQVKSLKQSGALPAGPAGRLLTVESVAGPLRVLTADVTSQGRTVAQVNVVGPLAPGRAQAWRAGVRIGAASLAGLLVGGVVLLVALRRALQPVHDLAAAARSVDLGDLSSRVPEPASRDEVASMAAEFNRMLDRMRDDERRRHQLLSAISHELRTPLAVARGHLELLETLDAGDPDTTAASAAVTRRELDRLGGIVDDLTAITHGGAAPIVPGPVFAPDVTAALADRVAGLNLSEVAIRPAPPVVVLGDEDRLTQVLLNLVMNAHTHTPSGTPIAVDAVAGDRQLTFRVRDAGPGIDAAVRDHVFDPFVTTKASGSQRTSGLGLSVVKALTEAQGGSVSLNSDHTGTTVAVNLATADGADDRADGEAARRERSRTR